MAQGAQEDAWSRTASLMALTVNMNKDPKKGKPAKAEDFYRFASVKKTKRKERGPEEMVDISILKDLFVGKKGK
jgi:hypothetical protein